MLKLENKRKIIITKTKAILALVMLAIFLCLTFYIDGKFYSKKTIAIINNTIKKPLAKPSTDTNMNLRESKVILKSHLRILQLQMFIIPMGTK